MKSNRKRMSWVIKIILLPIILIVIGLYLAPSALMGDEGPGAEAKRSWGTLLSVITNRMVYTAVTSWLVAQGTKIIIFVIKNRRMDFRLFVGTGGMPSSHVAFVTSLAAIMGFETGWTSPTFILMLGLSFIFITDAVGVRRAAGRTAAALNRLVDDLSQTGEIREERLKELLGHTPVEAIVGGIMGVATTMAFYAR